MAFLTEIKERIGATTDTRKITQSLELVAASKMKGFVRKAHGSRAYAVNLLRVMSLWRDAISTLPYADERESGAHVFVLVTSDKGLCGNLNHRLIKFLFSHPEWALPNTEVGLVCIGRKGEEQARRRGLEPLLSFPAIGERLTPLDALSIVDKIIQLWETGVARKISVVSPHYVNPFTSHPTLKTFLPFSLEMIASHAEWNTISEFETNFFTPPLLEPDRERVVRAFTLQLVQMLFAESFYELKAAEYASRMVAMKKATDAAGDMISELTLEYNKVRQEHITNQLAELATAAEAMEAW